MSIKIVDEFEYRGYQVRHVAYPGGGIALIGKKKRIEGRSDDAYRRWEVFDRDGEFIDHVASKEHAKQMIDDLLDGQLQRRA